MSCLEQYCIKKWVSSLRLWYEPKKKILFAPLVPIFELIWQMEVIWMEDPSSMFFSIVQSNQMGLLAEFPQSEIVPPSGRTPAPFVQYVTMSSILYTAALKNPRLIITPGFFFPRSMTSSKCAAMLMAVKCVPLNLGCPRAKPWASLMTFCWVITNMAITRICLQRWWLQQPRWWCPEYYPQPVGSRSLWQSPNIWSLWQC